MMVDPLEATFRARMRTLARKGGFVTKRRYGTDPRYYRSIGRLGGHASVAARKARIAAELEGVECTQAAIVGPPALPADTTPIVGRPAMTLAQVLAELESSETVLLDVSDRRKSLADQQAETDLARFIAHRREVESEVEDEPWDPLS